MTELQILQEIADLLKTRHPANEVMSEDEASSYLAISRTFFRELVGLYAIPHVFLKGKTGRGRKVYRKEDLDKFLKSLLINSSDEARRFQDGRRKVSLLIHK